MSVCPQCHKTYKTRHTCKAGICSECLIPTQNLSTHRCAIRKILSINLIDAWARIQETTRQSRICHSCETQHFLNKNVHGFRRFCHVDLCYDCYNIPQITEHVRSMRQKLLELDIRTGKWKCALCEVHLFDPVTGFRLQAFERDHIDVFDKTTTVWELLVTGATFSQLSHENNKCRNLCVRCHSAVTCAERTVGILRLKTHGVSAYVKQHALHQVETLTRMLLEHPSGQKERYTIQTLLQHSNGAVDI
jgi:hypothetical protein